MTEFEALTAIMIAASKDRIAPTPADCKTAVAFVKRNNKARAAAGLEPIQ